MKKYIGPYKYAVVFNFCNTKIILLPAISTHLSNSLLHKIKCSLQLLAAVSLYRARSVTALSRTV